MQKYEILMLAVPEITQDEIGGMQKNIEDVIQKSKGSLISFERWGKYKLCYPVEKNSYGVYLLTRFELPHDSQALKDLQSLFAIKLHTIVMRHVTTRLNPNQSLEYHRPKSLEETPDASDARTSIKEHKKIEGLISAVDSSFMRDDLDPEDELA
jgi:small subunit ribosomal protein S6